MLSAAARLPQVRTEACISLQASWEWSKVWTVWTIFGELKVPIKKRIIVRRSVRSMFGEQTFAKLRTGCSAVARRRPASFGDLRPQDRVHKPQPFWRERRAEAVSNAAVCPSAYQPNALPLGHTGSHFRLDSDDCGFICAGVNFVGGYKWHALFYLSFL